MEVNKYVSCAIPKAAQPKVEDTVRRSDLELIGLYNVPLGCRSGMIGDGQFATVKQDLFRQPYIIYHKHDDVQQRRVAPQIGLAADITTHDSLSLDVAPPFGAISEPLNPSFSPPTPSNLATKYTKEFLPD
jgi:hypothetical protein